MRRAFLLFTLAALLLPACGGTDRPEGVVERWLISLNQGKAGRPEKYVPDALSQRILPNWHQRDPGDLDVIEVGKGEGFLSTGRPPPDGEPSYLVPYRVKRLDGKEIRGTAYLHRIRAQLWHVTRLLPADPLLRVPSEGGQRIGGASSRFWLAGAAIAALLILLSVLLMSTVGRAARVSS
jgi:hypothetical protein